MRISSSVFLVAGLAAASLGLTGCVGEVGVEGGVDGVYYGPEYDNGPWFHDSGWVRGRRWDNGRDHHEVHAPPPRGGPGPHLPNNPRPSGGHSSNGGGHAPGGGGHAPSGPSHSGGSDHH